MSVKLKYTIILLHFNTLFRTKQDIKNKLYFSIALANLLKCRNNNLLSYQIHNKADGYIKILELKCMLKNI